MKKQEQKVDKRSKAYRDSLKKKPEWIKEVLPKKKSLGKVTVYKTGEVVAEWTSKPTAKLSQQAYEQDSTQVKQASHLEQLNDLYQITGEHSKFIKELLSRIEKLETKVG